MAFDPVTFAVIAGGGYAVVYGCYKMFGKFFGKGNKEKKIERGS